MKTLHYVALVCFVVIVGCTSTASPVQTAVGPLPGSLEGRVRLGIDFQTPVTTPYSGIRISLDNAPYSTTTDSRGFWRLDAIPAGSYDVRIHKDLFGTYMYYGVSVAGPGTSSVLERSEYGSPEIPLLTPTPVAMASIDSAGFVDWGISVTVSAEWSGLCVFYDLKQDVQPGDAHLFMWNDYSSLWAGPRNKVSWTLPIKGLQAAGVKSGDTIYVSACTDNSDGKGYYDPQGVEHLCSPGPKSNVVATVMP